MKKFLAAVLFTACMIPVLAQKRDGERIEKLKIAFLTEKLDLSVEESQKFWPVYNEHSDKTKESEREIKITKRELGQKSNPTEVEVSKAIELVTAAEIRKIEAQNEFLKRSLDILGAEKTLGLINSEREFRETIIKEFRNKEQSNGRMGPRGGR